MEKNVPTIMKSLLQSSVLLGLSYPIINFSTINQKLDIQSGVNPASGETPTLKYAMVGIGGISIQTGADNLAYTQTYAHKPTDTGLFKELPFVVRPVVSDIPNSGAYISKQNYRLRKQINNFQGEPCFAYYGKVVDFGTNLPGLQTRSVDSSGNVSISNFVPSNSNLSPTPTILSSGQSFSTAGNYVSAATKLDFVLNAQDILELLNSSMLLFGSENHAVISELALCSGVDRLIVSNLAGINVTYTEALAVQVMSFLSTNFPSSSFSQGIKYSFDIGNSEPLLVST